MTPVKGQKPAEGGNQKDKAWVLDVTVEPGHHVLPVIIKSLLRTPSPISRSPSLGERGKDSGAISFQGFGICAAEGEMLETEESPLSHPAERVLHLTLSVSARRMLLLCHRLFQGAAINLESSIQDPPQIQLFSTPVRGECLFNDSGIFLSDSHVHLGLNYFTLLSLSV